MKKFTEAMKYGLISAAVATVLSVTIIYLFVYANLVTAGILAITLVVFVTVTALVYLEG